MRYRNFEVLICQIRMENGPTSPDASRSKRSQSPEFAGAAAGPLLEGGLDEVRRLPQVRREVPRQARREDSSGSASLFPSCVHSPWTNRDPELIHLIGASAYPKCDP